MEFDEKNVFKFYHGRLPHWRLPGGLYYLTLNLYKINLSSEEMKIVYDAILFWNNKKYVVLCFVILTDHVHIICSFGEDEKDDDLSNVMKSIKVYSANRINKLRKRKGIVWQRDFFNRVLRGDHELKEKINYMWENPMKRELTENTYDYPFWWYNFEYFDQMY